MPQQANVEVDAERDVPRGDTDTRCPARLVVLRYSAATETASWTPALW
jgi:hypothetical protein